MATHLYLNSPLKVREDALCPQRASDNANALLQPDQPLLSGLDTGSLLCKHGALVKYGVPTVVHFGLGLGLLLHVVSEIVS